MSSMHTAVPARYAVMPLEAFMDVPNMMLASSPGIEVKYVANGQMAFAKTKYELIVANENESGLEVVMDEKSEKIEGANNFLGNFFRM